jgi:hypothetical protein
MVFNATYNNISVISFGAAASNLLHAYVITPFKEIDQTINNVIAWY